MEPDSLDNYLSEEEFKKYMDSTLRNTEDKVGGNLYASYRLMMAMMLGSMFKAKVTHDRFVEDLTEVLGTIGEAMQTMKDYDREEKKWKKH
jgi:hypothetical protein